MSSIPHLLPTAGLLACLMALAPQAVIADQQRAPGGRNSPINTWSPLSDRLLDQYRGGFVDISGVKISFGLQRTVWVNEQLVQSLTLTVPDLTSLPSKGSAGAVSGQGPGAITVSVNPVSIVVPQVIVPRIHAASLQPIAQSGSVPTGSVLSSPPPTSALASGNPASQPSVATSPSAAPIPGTPAAQHSALPRSAFPNASAPIVTRTASPGGVTVASVIQNGPGNVVAPDVFRNLGPGALTVVQNTLNNQTIQGLTVINTQLTGLSSVMRQNIFSNLQLNLQGAGR
jgi:hypothetical protein